jgi:hypothetical protein
MPQFQTHSKHTVHYFKLYSVLVKTGSSPWYLVKHREKFTFILPYIFGVIWRILLNLDVHHLLCDWKVMHPNVDMVLFL